MKHSPAKLELDSIVGEIELTLISIIQGVALSFLIDSARQVASIKQAIFWPYVVAGLLVIFVFWSRSVLHIITLIRWPLEFGHNFLYIACALVESVLFTSLTNPARWFALNAVFAAVGWILFIYDLRLIHARERDSAGPASTRLNAAVTRDQWTNIAVLVPGVFLLNLVCWICIRTWPDLFLDRGWHVYLICGQTVGSATYLWYVIMFFRRLAPTVLEARGEWRSAGDQ